MPIGDVNVDITARLDRLESGMKRAEGIVRESADRIEKNTDLQPFGGITAQAAKVFAALSTIEAGFRGLDAAVNIFKGDFEEADRLLRSLPLGIGPALAATADFLRNLLGINDAQEEQNRLMERGIEINRRITDERIKHTDALNEQSVRLEQLNDQLRSLFIEQEKANQLVPGLFGARSDQLELQRDIAIREARRLAEEQGTLPDEEIDLINRIFDLRIENARREQRLKFEQQRELRNREREAEREAERDRQEAVDNRLESFFEGIEQAAAIDRREQMQLAADIEAMELESQGRIFEAREVRIRAEFDRRRELADTEIEREHTKRLEALQLEANERERLQAEQADRRSLLERFVSEGERPPRIQLGQELQVGRTNFAAFATPQQDPLVRRAGQMVDHLRRIEANTRRREVEQILGADR